MGKDEIHILYFYEAIQKVQLFSETGEWQKYLSYEKTFPISSKRTPAMEKGTFFKIPNQILKFINGLK